MLLANQQFLRNNKNRRKAVLTPRGRNPLYKPYRYVPPHRAGFSLRFGLKTGIHFAHFGLESGMIFEGTTECMNVFVVSIPNELRKKEKYANSKWIFCFRSNLSNDNV